MSDATSTSSTRDAYYQKVERHFGIRRGGPILLSPRDWQLLDAWYEQGVPLRIVLRGINEAFDRFEVTATSRRINSLGYCAQHIEAAWERDRDLGAADGRADATGTPGAAHLRDCAVTCRDLATVEPDVATALRKAAEALETLAQRDAGIDEIDVAASAIEAHLRESLARADRTLRLPRFSPWGV